MLTVNNLRFAWPGNSRAVLDIPSLELADGETLFARAQNLPDGGGTWQTGDAVRAVFPASAIRVLRD